MNSPVHLTCDQLHQKAMDAAELAMQLEKQRKTSAAIQQFGVAFDWEKKSAMTLAYQFEAEPSRSIIFRSAACLAIKAKQFEEAERMAAFGLIGTPPSEIAEELREVMDKVRSYLKVAA